MIHIGRAGTKLGVFTEEEVRQGLASGRFVATDLGWEEDMENWLPLSQFTKLTAPATPPPLPVQEIAAPEEDARHGFPWDERAQRGVVAAFFQTVKQVLFSPGEAFSRMRTDSKLSGPILFNIIGGWIGLVVIGIYAVQQAKWHPMAQEIPNLHLPAEQAKQLTELYTPEMQQKASMAMLKSMAVMGPFLATMMALAAALVIHFILMLVGGANKAFHVTLRVVFYCAGSVVLLLPLAPISGLQSAMAWVTLWMAVWLIASCGSGLAAAHETSKGRCVVTMIVFFALCFVALLGMVQVAMTAGAA
jgi:hypothetical protein